MSDNTHKDNEFYALADAFINLANEKCRNADPGKISATILYAAARFNTFIVATGAKSAEDFAASREKSFDFFIGEYRKMLVEHFADYEEHFDRYMKS